MTYRYMHHYFLSGMLSHGSVPEELLLYTVIPIPKDKNTNLTDSAPFMVKLLILLFYRDMQIIFVQASYNSDSDVNVLLICERWC